ncbi:hypothetical protein BV22DRAFT_71108 [Leucogyrophana mollusca]|uniref:Uncharacterized protein n=1 Tax=Leucogyrophana mollusca TaxID=85980 RepID=A0ACB8BWG9_9AGAM|nr:hypothetical protein BV22DRAFT_71108 [Leucogyrophana mollusca]
MPSPNLVTTFGGNILPLSPKSRTSFKSVSPRKPMRPEVRVTTDSYTLAEFTPTSGTLTASTSMRSPKSPYGKDWPEPDSDRTSSDSDHARPPKLEIIDENGQLTPHSPHSKTKPYDDALMYISCLNNRTLHHIHTPCRYRIPVTFATSYLRLPFDTIALITLYKVTPPSNNIPSFPNVCPAGWLRIPREPGRM